jgi:hypothetical protein
MAREEVITFNLTEEEKTALDRAGDRDGMARATFVRRLVLRELRDYGLLDPLPPPPVEKR